MTALSFLPRSAGSSSCAASKKRTMRCVVMMVLSGLVGVVSGFGVPSTSTSTTTTTTTTTHTPFVFGMSTKWCPQPPVQQQSKSRLWFQPDDEEDKQLFWPSDDWKEEERIQRMAMFLSSHLGRAVLKTCLQKKEEQEPSEEPDVPEEAETLSAPVTPAAAAEEEDVLLKEEEEKHSVSLHQREGDRVLALKDEFSTGEEDVAPAKPQDVRNFGKPLPVIATEDDENADVTAESKVSLVPGSTNVDRDTTTASLRDKGYVDPGPETATQPLTSSSTAEDDEEEEEERAISMHEKEGDRMVSLKDEFATGTNVVNNNDNNNDNNNNNLPPVVSTMFGRPLEVIESGLSPISDDGHDPPPGQATTSSSSTTISSSSTSLQAGYSSSLVEQDSTTTTTMSSSTSTTQETSSMPSSSLSQLDVLNNLQLMAQVSSPPPPPPSSPSLSRSSSTTTTTTTTTYYNNNDYNDYEHDTTRTPSSVEAQLDAKLLAQLEEALMGPNSPSANKGSTSTVGEEEEDAATAAAADDEDSAVDDTATGTALLVEETSHDDFAHDDDTDAAVLEIGDDSSNDDTDVTVSTMEVSTMADAATNDPAVDTATAAAADKALGDDPTDLEEDISEPLAAAAATTSDNEEEEEVLATPKPKHVVLDRVKKSLGKVFKKRTAETTTTTRAVLDIPTVMDDGNDEETPSNNDNNKNHVVAARAIVDQVKTQAKKISAEARDLVTGRARDISTSAGAAYTKNNRAGGGGVVGSGNNDKKKKKKFKKPTNNNHNKPRNVDLQETAFQSLLKLRMFRITPNPKDPGYDHSDDDELCSENVWVDPNHKNGAAVAVPTRGITSATSAAATATTVQLSHDEIKQSDFLSIPPVTPSSSTVAATTRTKQEEFSVETSSLPKKKKNKELEERAFQILLDLGMIRITPNPNDPYYDHTDDNELCPENVWIN